MTQFQRWIVGMGLVGALGIGFSVLRANDESATPTPQDQIAKLVARIDGLEKRLAILEAEREQATRQASAQSDSPTPLLPVPRAKEGSGFYPPKAPEPGRPAARVFLLKQSQQAEKP